ncbi:Methyltransferase-like protein 7B [Quaeritorhiza haematococci]|nr:Methyltransferase-like protein 7B [Quaeritorhiza haematococci]
MSRRLATIGITATAGLGLYLTVASSAYHYQKIRNLPPPPEGISHPAFQADLIAKGDEAQRKDVYDELASSYDNAIDWDEWFMRVGARRCELLRKARGSVLEVSGGTGRNIPYFSSCGKHINALTITDRNKHMLQQAFQKYTSHRLDKSFPVTFNVMDAGSLPVSPKSYDTVIQTFGLCSCEDPVLVLKELGRVCKDDGRILLLEHGRSYWSWMNEILDKGSMQHRMKWGCWWNRDIEGMLKESGLEIESIHRYHFGTTYQIIAKPSAKPSNR